MMKSTSNITPLRLLTLYEVSRKINSQLNLARLLDEIMDQAIALLHAEKGLILLRDQPGGELVVWVARAMDRHAIGDAANISRSVIEKVEKAGEPVLIQNIPDLRSADASKSMLMYKLKSIICVPLHSKEALIGAIYLDTTQSERFFKEEDVAFLEAFANLAGIAIDNARTYQEIEHLNANLEQKVAERTAELHLKNQELTDAYQKLRDAQLQLIRQEKMASLGQLAAGVAHEINNPLGSLSSNIDMFTRGFEKVKAALGDLDVPSRPALDKKLRQTLDMLQQLSTTSQAACQRISEVVKALRNFARLDEEEFKEVNLHDGIDNTLVLLEPKYRERIRIIKEYGNLPPYRCQAAQINQVFMNLIANACEAIPQGKEGLIHIKTAVEEEAIRIEINDNGAGISAENLSKIFDPGFTTKGVKVGTGLGLSICYQIVQDHGGAIQVNSEAGKGSSFTIRLPLKKSIGPGEVNSD